MVLFWDFGRNPAHIDFSMDGVDRRRRHAIAWAHDVGERPIVCGVGSTMDVPVTANDDSPGHAGNRVPSAPISAGPEAEITFAATFAKPKIFELDIGIAIIVLALLRCLGLPQSEVAATVSMTVIGHRSWSCGGARSCSSRRLPTAAFARGAVTLLSGYTLD